MNIKQIYEEGLGHSIEAAIAAVYKFGVDETNKLRDEAENLIAGVDVKALQTTNAQLVAEVGALQAQLAEWQKPAPVQPNPVQPSTAPVASPGTAVAGQDTTNPVA